MSLVARNNLFPIDRFFNDAVRRASSSDAPEFFTPRVDILDVDDRYEITAELPGVAKADIQLHVKEGVLTLEAESTRPKSTARDSKEAGGEEQTENVIRRERRYGRYMRSFNLGADVQESDINASFSDGVLTLVVPKAIEKVPERHRIEVA